MFTSKNVYFWNKKSIMSNATQHAAELKTESGKAKALQNAKEKCNKLDEKLAALKATKPLSFASISVEWAKSAIWGYNPTASATISNTDKYEYTNGHASGCGYDKLSAAVASALNDSEIIRATMINGIRKLNAAKKAKSYMVYGLTDSLGFSGGTGVNCYKNIFEILGYEWKEEEGRTYNHITISKAKKH
jgi:hypothetical protein